MIGFSGGGDALRRALLGVMLLAASAGAGVAQAPLRPKVSSTGVEKPASLLWVGNSFFYFNNSMHGHFSALLRAADPATCSARLR